MTGDLFTTAVSEEKLQEARDKSLMKIFGSSQVFLDVHNKTHECPKQTYEDIVQGKMNEHYQRGLQCLAQNKWEAAVNAFSKAIYLCPEKVELYVKRAEAFLQLCDFKSAALNLKKACSIAPPPKEHIELLALTYYLQGQSLFEKDCHLEALESFTQAAELQPQNRHYHMRSIACLAVLGRYSESIHLLNKLLEEEQGNPDIYIQRAWLYDQLNQATLCYQDVHTALSLDRQHREACDLRDKMVAKAEEAKEKAVNLAVQGDLQDALRKICCAIENNPLSAEYHIFRGTVYKKLKDFSPAVDDFVCAMQLLGAEGRYSGEGARLHTEAENQLLLTYNDFAVQCYMKGFYQEGALLLNKALKGDRSRKELFTRRQYQQAERHFSEAIMKHPLLPELYLHRARLRRSVQNITGAQEDAVISILLNHETAPTIMNFFPGKTLEEIITSKIASGARCFLQRNLENLPATCIDPIQSTRGEMNSALPGTKRDLSVCMTDQQLGEMVVRRRKLKTDIQAEFNRQGYLNSTAPRIGRPPQPQVETPDPQAPYHWRTFGLGLTSSR
ncbi:hypothetical protein GDO81_003800 [Engystomops pustulosus]|uniref:Tetratricopeptide repeat protein 16 n=1 Tax=Engystomops pustulosus TaxID=76066 RepID=A0AAV7A4R1_ENGPU|nr:hypothetical protein GDO81_003800 [Engystomops pustulosus]